MSNNNDVKPLVNDLCFKFVFSHEFILKDFINSFLEYLKLDVRFDFTDIGVQEYIMPNNKTYLGYFGDIIVTLDNGIIISIELYKDNYREKDYNKSYAYMCRLFDKNVIDSKEYKVRKIISLNLMKGNYKRENKELVNKYTFVNDRSKKNIDNENTVMYLVRLDLVKNIQYTKDIRFINWLRLLNAESIEEMEEIGKDDKIMEEAREFVRKWLNKTPEENLENYIKDVKKMARTEENESRTIEIAKNLLSLNININDVSKATGLTIKEINKLKGFIRI